MGTLKGIYTKANYRTSLKNFFTAMRYALSRYTEYQAEFLALSTTYTLEWADTMLGRLTVLENMLDEQARDDMHEALRVELYNLSTPCLTEYKKLESHIIRAFPKDLHKTKLEAAGSTYYRKAGQRDWESILALLQAAVLFMDENGAILTAGGMPVSFPDNFATVQVNFQAKYTAFLDAEAEVYTLRNAKITACNQFFKEISVMLKDGQKIFRLDESVRKNFEYTWIINHITGGDDTKAAKATAKAKTNQKENQKIVNIGLKLENGATITVNHGDNTKREITGDGVNTNFYDKVYLLLKIFTILFTGAINKILEIHINNSNLIYFKLHKSMKKLQKFIAQGNQFPTAVVDDLLITINEMGTSGPDCVVNLLNSEPPSAAGLQAKAELESRGWVVLVAS